MAGKQQKQNQRSRKKTPQKRSRPALFESGNGRLLSLLIVFSVPVILYLQTVSFGFIRFDDNTIIANHVDFLKDLNNIPEAFQTDAFINGGSHFYRPVQTVSYMIDLQLSGVDNPWMFHLRQVVMLGVIAVLLLLVLIRFRIPRGLAVLATLLYCVHPLFVSNIAWIPARGDLQLMLFGLLAFLFFMEFLQKKTYTLLLLSWLAFTIALFSKETAALLPLVMLLYWLLIVKEKRFDGRYVVLIALYAVSGVVWFWMRARAIGDFAGGDELMGALSQNGEVGLVPFLLNLQTIPESLANFFFPFDIDPLPGFSAGKTITGIAILAALGVLLITSKSRPVGEKLFALLWFLLLLAPTMLFKPYHIDYLHHRFFLPMAGILLLVLLLFPRKWLTLSNTTVALVLTLLVLVLAGTTYVKTRAYEDPMAFYNSAIDANPEAGFAYIHRGYLYQSQGRYPQSVADFSRAIDINPGYAEAFNNRGIVLAAQGQYGKAIADYTKALELKPGSVETWNNRGLAYAYQGQYDRAIADYNQALELDPDLAEGWNNLGMAYGNRGDMEKAIEGFAKAVALKPGYAMAHNNLGLALAAQGDLTGACREFNTARKLGLKEAKANAERYCR